MERADIVDGKRVHNHTAFEQASELKREIRKMTAEYERLMRKAFGTENYSDRLRVLNEQEHKEVTTYG